MSRFRCAVCGKIYEGDINSTNLSCECGSTIFYKERPNVKRVFTSD